MSPRHWSYVAMLAFCLAATLPLHRWFSLRVLSQPRRLVTAVVPVAACFLAWDAWATHVGQWRFDAGQVLAARVAGLPLEEVAFFLVVPLAAIITYESVRVVRRDTDRSPR